MIEIISITSKTIEDNNYITVLFRETTKKWFKEHTKEYQEIYYYPIVDVTGQFLKTLQANYLRFQSETKYSLIRNYLINNC